MENLSQHEVADIAAQFGMSGFSCSEAVAGALGVWLGLNKEELVRLSSGFAGGMGMAGETCGVVAAGILVLGSLFGPVCADDAQGRGRVLMLASEYAERFAQENGATLCRSLCEGMEMKSPEGRKFLRESGKPEELIRSGTKLLAELIQREKDNVAE